MRKPGTISDHWIDEFFTGCERVHQASITVTNPYPLGHFAERLHFMADGLELSVVSLRKGSDFRQVEVE